MAVTGSRFEGALLAYRVSRPGRPVFDGGGAMRRAGRWSTPPRRVINCATVYALAILENVVHWNIGNLPPGMRFVRCSIPVEVSREVLEPPDLPGWDRDDYGVSQPFGNRWYDEQRSAVLIVPSVVSPFEPNALINQVHPEFAGITVTPEAPAILDRRLVRS